ncbi:hypothetical protein [Paramylibacter ulvae]|uniref:hypothetical protein n=1 Tax=Paramylibacter ulvae TaxID=1651968 RepID=UPI001E3A333A|nr:hypothetical protein [Amylibacter ulvae]
MDMQTMLANIVLLALFLSCNQRFETKHRPTLPREKLTGQRRLGLSIMKVALEKFFPTVSSPTAMTITKPSLIALLLMR